MVGEERGKRLRRNANFLGGDWRVGLGVWSWLGWLATVIWVNGAGGVCWVTWVTWVTLMGCGCGCSGRGQDEGRVVDRRVRTLGGA